MDYSSVNITFKCKIELFMFKVMPFIKSEEVVVFTYFLIFEY